MTVNPSSRRSAAALTRFAAIGMGAGLAACGGGGSPTSPPPPPPPSIVIAVAGGNNQSAKVGLALPDPLRVVVTKDGAVMANQTVTWQVATGTATVNPGSGPTDAQGVATTAVTIGGAVAGVLTISATTTGATSGVTFSANAIAAVGAVAVTNNSFTPSSITITAGGTVSFTWGNGAMGHNIVPDGSTIPSIGAFYDAPFSIDVTFPTAGTYNYHCANHGSPGGGMHGTVTVVP
ncbi:MAG: plastocyanin/azurin family copper-binding protein [Gemmatimonadota bacterium]